MSTEPSETRQMQFRNSNCPRNDAKTQGFRSIATRKTSFASDGICCRLAIIGSFALGLSSSGTR